MNEKEKNPNFKHGLRHSRLYGIWLQMKNRCYNLKTERYPDYGGRGITICNEWKDDFKAFYDWAMSHGYQENLTIDRINNDGNYEPSNCRWITRERQAINKRNNHNITFNGETHCYAEWARITGIPRHAIVNRIAHYGWSIDRALTTPLCNQGRH